MSNILQQQPRESLPSVQPTSKTIEISDELDWDSFLKRSPSGHHVQSESWAMVKKFNGWKSIRLKVDRDKKTVGGAQVLIRPARGIGQVAFVPKGPVLDECDSEMSKSLLDQLIELTRKERIGALFVQPPETGIFESDLRNAGFRPCPIETTPDATTLVNLDAPLDEILARMSKSMRNGIRRSQRRGIEVRNGDRSDLPDFYRLLQATSQRRNYSIFPLEYFENMWDCLASNGDLQLFIAEFEGQPVTAQLCIIFGDTITAKQIGWSGEYRHQHPNEALDWFTIEWAKSRGIRYYDLEGIERAAAKALAEGRPLPAEFQDTPTSYKMKLGGEVRMFPGCWCRWSNPVLRTMYNRVGYSMLKRPLFKKVAERFRTG